jgi:hypothetical protein
MTENRGRTTDDGRQRTDDRGQMTEGFECGMRNAELKEKN